MSEFAFTINYYLVVAFLMVLLYYIDRCDVLFLREEVILMIFIEKRADINNIFEAIRNEIRSGKHVIITDAALKRLWEETCTAETGILRRSIVSKTRPNGDREIVPLAESVVFMTERKHCVQLERERHHRYTTVLSFCSMRTDWEVEMIPIQSLEGSPTNFFVASIHRKDATKPWTKIPWDSDWNTTGFLASSEREPVVIVLP